MKSIKQETWFSNVFLQILIIFISSVLLTVFINQFLPSTLPLILSYGKRPGILSKEVNDMLYVDARSATSEISTGNSVLIDVRDKKDFMNLHPANAINIPYHESEDVYNEFIRKVPVNRKIFILCSGNLCDMSVRVAKHLSDMGYKNTIIIKQNFNDWIRLNLPTEKDSVEN